MIRMKKAYNKDIWRSIKKGKKRFLSILMITTLGVTMLTGLKAASDDLRYSADQLYDNQNLYDISIVSTLGLTDEDVETLAQLEGVENAEGAYSETVYTLTDNKRQSAEVKVLSQKGLNTPYLLEGVLPQTADEVAVTGKYIQDTGKSIGDTLSIEEKAEENEEDPTFVHTTYTITAVVIDPMDLNNAESATAFRSNSSTDYTFFVTPEAVNNDIFTAVYLTLSGSKELLSYSDKYEESVKQVVQTIESRIKTEREQARYDSITGEAYDKLSDAEREMMDKFAEADAEFADAKQKIDDGYAALTDGEAKLDQSEKELSEGEQQLQQGKTELTQQQAATNTQLSAARTQLKDSQSQTLAEQQKLSGQAEQIAKPFSSAWPSAEWSTLLTAAEKAYMPVAGAQVQVNQLEQQLAAHDPASAEYAALEKQLAAAKAQMQQAEAAVPGAVAPAQNEFLSALASAVNMVQQNIDSQIAALDPAAPDYENQLSALEAQKMQIDELPDTLLQMSYGLGQLRAMDSELSQQLSELDKQQATTNAQFQAAWAIIAEKEAQLEDGRRQLDEGRAELERSRTELEDGAKELAEHKQEYAQERAAAEQKIEDARTEIADIDMAQWYVQDRSSLSGYVNIQSDASSIEAVGTAFPIVFFIVAILISLTTITRMVEEERGLIGTYMALGFTNREILRKYLLYAFAACLIGGILGDLLGFILLPNIIFSIFDTMYLLPEYVLQFNIMYGIGGVLLFVVGIVGATAIACRSELRHMPVVLMRPKSPRAGSRVMLEYIPLVWNQLSFLNKVTARNLFRYKKRLFMTIAGIMGCTALVLCGFAIKDTVTDLMPKQYEHIYSYDLMAVSTAEHNSKLLSYVSDDSLVADYLNVQIDSVKVKNMRGGEEKMQLIVVPDNASLDGYIQLEDLSGKPLQLSGNDIFITQNASQVLNFDEGDTVSIQDAKLTQKEVKVTRIVQNYLGNSVYMTQEAYESTFGTYAPNGILANLSDNATDQPAYAESLSKQDGVLSAVSTEALKRDFSSSFSLINMVVYVIIVMAAGLAFVVLFTLSTTNISERTRELATIKVLGFYDKEVHLYVNKETLILTSLGILLGLPVGYALGSSLTYVLNMPSIHFAVSIHPISYLIAAVISFCFAVIVNLITNRTLDHVNMVEALKSVE